MDPIYIPACPPNPLMVLPHVDHLITSTPLPTLLPLLNPLLPTLSPHLSASFIDCLLTRLSTEDLSEDCCKQVHFSLCVIYFCLGDYDISVSHYLKCISPSKEFHINEYHIPDNLHVNEQYILDNNDKKMNLCENGQWISRLPPSSYAGFGDMVYLRWIEDTLRVKILDQYKQNRQPEFYKFIFSLVDGEYILPFLMETRDEEMLLYYLNNCVYKVGFSEGKADFSGGDDRIGLSVIRKVAELENALLFFYNTFYSSSPIQNHQYLKCGVKDMQIVLDCLMCLNKYDDVVKYITLVFIYNHILCCDIIFYLNECYYLDRSFMIRILQSLRCVHDCLYEYVNNDFDDNDSNIVRYVNEEVLRGIEGDYFIVYDQGKFKSKAIKNQTVDGVIKSKCNKIKVHQSINNKDFDQTNNKDSEQSINNKDFDQTNNKDANQGINNKDFDQTNNKDANQGINNKDFDQTNNKDSEQSINNKDFDQTNNKDANQGINNKDFDQTNNKDSEQSINNKDFDQTNNKDANQGINNKDTKQIYNDEIQGNNNKDAKQIYNDEIQGNNNKDTKQIYNDEIQSDNNKDTNQSDNNKDTKRIYNNEIQSINNKDTKRIYNDEIQSDNNKDSKQIYKDVDQTNNDEIQGKYNNNKDTSQTNNNEIVIPDDLSIFDILNHILDKMDSDIKSIGFLLGNNFKRSTHLSLLAKNNKTDFSFLQSLIRPVLRSSSLHTAIIYSNAFMNIGTSNDTFYRMNQDLVFQCKQWNKFNSLSSLGLIHLSNYASSLSVFKNLLPNAEDMMDGGICMALGTLHFDESPVKTSENVFDFLMNLADSKETGKGEDNGQNDLMVYGCVIAIGLVKCMSGDFNVVEKMCEIVKDGCVMSACAAGIAIGCVMMKDMVVDSAKVVDKNDGSKGVFNTSVNHGDGKEDNKSANDGHNKNGSDVINSVNNGDGKEDNISVNNDDDKEIQVTSTESFLDSSDNGMENEDDNFRTFESVISFLLNTAKKSPHEKVVRGCGLGISLSMMNRNNHMENKDKYSSNHNNKNSNIIREMLRDRNEYIRSSGCLSLGTSQLGSCDTKTLQILLSYINDSSEDVKRSAIIGIGLVCASDTTVLLNILEPLATSHSSFVRGTVGVVLGFFFSGIINKRVSDIIEVLLYDSELLVRQSGCIGMGFHFCQMNSKIAKRYGIPYKRVVERFSFLMVDRQENNAVAIGAVIGRALMESGGRNIIYSIKNLYGKVCIKRAMGFVIMMQYWYDYALLSIASICIFPTFNVVVDVDNLDLMMRDQNFIRYNENKAYDVSRISNECTRNNISVNDNKNVESDTIKNNTNINSEEGENKSKPKEERRKKFVVTSGRDYIFANSKNKNSNLNENQPSNKSFVINSEEYSGKGNIKVWGDKIMYEDEPMIMPEIKQKKRKRSRKRYKTMEIVIEETIDSNEENMEIEEEYEIKSGERITIDELERSGKNDYGFCFIKKD